MRIDTKNAGAQGSKQVAPQTFCASSAVEMQMDLSHEQFRAKICSKNDGDQVEHPGFYPGPFSYHTNPLTWTHCWGTKWKSEAHFYCRHQFFFNRRSLSREGLPSPKCFQPCDVPKASYGHVSQVAVFFPNVDSTRPKIVYANVHNVVWSNLTTTTGRNSVVWTAHNVLAKILI